MSTTHIKPTVGRVVWFYPSTRTGSTDFSQPAAGEPLAAIVAAVLQGQIAAVVNLTVFDAVGHPHSRTMVPLLQDGQDVPEDGYYAAWMPYQTGQAKKAEERAHDAKQLAVASDREADDKRLRAGMLDMALRTPGVGNHDDVLQAAAAYQAHIEGENTLPASTIETKVYADGTTTTGAAPLPATSPDGSPALPPHQQRVIDEKRDLDTKLAKLLAFFNTPIFAGLDEEERQRMGHQAAAMQEYSTLLGERIAAFATLA